MSVFSAAFVSAAEFSDTNGHWAESEIDEWAGRGVLSGYSDGTFLPDNNITRAEMAKVIVSAMGGGTVPTENYFSDVQQDEWYYAPVSTAAAAGYVSGDTDGRFRPNDYITRQEASAIFARAYNVASGAGVGQFADAASISDWAVENVSGLVEAGVIKGYEDGTFRPLDNITRAEVVVMLDRLDGGSEPIVTTTPENNSPATAAPTQTASATPKPTASSMFGGGGGSGGVDSAASRSNTL